MPSVACQFGLCSCHEQYTVVLTDEDGTDIAQAFKDEIDAMMANPELHYIPVPFYISTGSLGMLHTESVIVFVYAGIPFIFGSRIAISGAGLGDAFYSEDGGRLLASIYGNNNRRVYSLGYTRSGSPLEHAVDYLTHNPPIASPDIDETVAEHHIVFNKTNERVGVISKDGGTRLEIYAFDTDESRMIRSNKDFVGGTPYAENGIPEGRTEVVAYGGLPEIIQIGEICSTDGYLYDVWVPNVPVITRVAKDIFNDEVLPRDALYTNLEELEECYALFHRKLVELEDEAVKNEIAYEEDTESPPEIPEEES